MKVIRILVVFLFFINAFFSSFAVSSPSDDEPSIEPENAYEQRVFEHIDSCKYQWETAECSADQCANALKLLIKPRKGSLRRATYYSEVEKILKVKCLPLATIPLLSFGTTLEEIRLQGFYEIATDFKESTKNGNKKHSITRQLKPTISHEDSLPKDMSQPFNYWSEYWAKDIKNLCNPWGDFWIIQHYSGIDFLNPDDEKLMINSLYLAAQYETCNFDEMEIKNIDGTTQWVTQVLVLRPTTNDNCTEAILITPIP